MPVIPKDPLNPGPGPGSPTAAPLVMPALGTLEVAYMIDHPGSAPPNWYGAPSPEQLAWAADWLAANTPTPPVDPPEPAP